MPRTLMRFAEDSERSLGGWMPRAVVCGCWRQRGHATHSPREVGAPGT